MFELGFEALVLITGMEERRPSGVCKEHMLTVAK